MNFFKQFFICVCVCVSFQSLAQVERDFLERASFNTNGNIALIGNTLLTCQSSNNCTDTQNGLTNTTNNNLNMVNVNIDTAAGLSNSSSADLNMPVGSTVLFAGLYWGARADETDISRNKISIKAPGQNMYTEVTATVIDTIPNINDAASRPYQAVADVTNLVLASGNGTYFVGDLSTLTGKFGGGLYGGWSLVVIYQDNNQPFRRLMLFDGAANVGGTNTVSVDVTGLLTPVSGDFDTFIGALSWEGDKGITGDALTFEGDTISQNINSNNNFWNGSISNLDSHVNTKSPNYINQLSMDIDMVDVSDSLDNGATSANIEFSTGGDGYYPHYLAFVTELFLPDFDSNMSKTATDLNGGVVSLGDEIEYTISFQNSGQDGATNTVLMDPIPANTTYVANSLEVTNATTGPSGTPTDTAGDDIAEYDAVNNEVVFRLGNGADQNNGGTFLENEGATVKFRVTINNNAPAGDIENIATITSNSFIFPADTFTAEDGATINLGDVTPPTPPVIITPTEGDQTNDIQPVVSGSTEPNAFITVTGPNGETCTTQANSAGGWSCQLSPALSDGSNLITVTARDNAGNISDPATVGINVDTAAPIAAVCEVTPDPANNGTMVTAICSGVESGATVLIPGYVCQAEINNEVTCTATVGENGVDGNETATTVDPAGNTATSPATFTLDNTAPTGAVCAVTPDPASTGTPLTATCTGVETGVTVTIPGYVCGTESGNEVVCTATAGQGGVEGDEIANITDKAGNTSTTPATFTLDDVAPAAPTIVSPTIGLTVSGTGEPGLTVTVTTPSGATCMAVVENNGTWRCDLSSEPIDGEIATATQSDDAGNVSNSATAVVAYRPDLSSFVTNCVAGVKPSQNLMYSVTVLNTGNVDVINAVVTTDLGDQIDVSDWSCDATNGAICNNTIGNGDFNELVDLPAGSGLVYIFETPVIGPEMNFVDVSSTVTMPTGTTDTNISDNTAFDSDLIYQFIFKDTFDCAAPGTIESSSQMSENLLNQ